MQRLEKPRQEDPCAQEYKAKGLGDSKIPSPNDETKMKDRRRKKNKKEGAERGRKGRKWKGGSESWERVLGR